MKSIEQMEREWEEVTAPLAMRINHFADGAHCLQWFRSLLNESEMLRLQVSEEPYRAGNRLGWHASVSIGPADGSPGTLRPPTHDEYSAALIQACRVSNAHFGSHTRSSDGLVFHMWEE